MATQNKTTNRKLNGIYSGLSYMGVNPTTPPNSVVVDRVPTVDDYGGYLVGDLWILPNIGIIPSQTDAQIWILTALAARKATWTQIFPTSAASLDFVTDSGTASPLLGILNINGAANISTAGSGNTVAIGISGTTNHAVQIGNAGGSLTSVVGVGTAGQVLTSNGVGVDPTWQNSVAAGLIFDGDTGTTAPLAGTINFNANTNTADAGSSVSFSAALGFVNLITTDALDNTIIGMSAGNATISGIDNTAVGRNNLNALTSGDGNSAVGYHALQAITSGSDNVALGRATGTAYTTSESSNILIGSLVAGTIGENNTLRIGSGTGAGVGNLAQAFISGIDGVNVGSVATVVTEASNQLGTAVITAGTGITITPGANTITIAATGVSLTATSFLGTGGTNQFNAIAGITWLCPNANSPTAVQADSQFSMPVGGVISRLYVNVGANASTASTTVTINKNGVNTALVATITALTTGVYTDLVNTVTFVAGDTLQFEMSQATTGTCVGTVSVLFTS